MLIGSVALNQYLRHNVDYKKYTLIDRNKFILVLL